MRKKIDSHSLKILMLLKFDANRLFDRIKYRAPEYLYEFSLKRTRDHFLEIFKNRYEIIAFQDLLLCGPEVLVALDQYYSLVDELRWYLNHTQDLPNRIEDKVFAYIKELERVIGILNLFIEAELNQDLDSLQKIVDNKVNDKN